MLSILCLRARVVTDEIEVRFATVRSSGGMHHVWIRSVYVVLPYMRYQLSYGRGQNQLLREQIFQNSSESRL